LSESAWNLLQRFWMVAAPVFLVACATTGTSPAPQTALATASIPGLPPASPLAAPGAAGGSAAPTAATTLHPDDPILRALSTHEPLVDTISGDLFERIRHGFALVDIDQPAIDRELNWYANHPDYLERTFGRSELYLHYIVEELHKRNMPLELALLPVVESAFEPYAYSRARAAGLWQFIPGTAQRFGLKQNWWYDGRRDVVESTRAALDYLQTMHDRFNGDWLLAIAGYNCGERNVDRAVEQNLALGKPTDFWHLKLPAETRGYVPKLLAMRRLVKNPEAYGLEFSRIADQPYFTQIATGGQIDLQVVADLAGISKDEVYELNPAFHRWATDPSGPYELLMPIDVATGLEAALLELSPEQRMRAEPYAVQPGDSVASIAQRFRATPALIREMNDMAANDHLVAGATLRVPSTHIELPQKAARAALLVDGRAAAPRRGTRPVVHVVRSGDSLWSIARRLGTDTRTLASLNGMAVSDTLKVGQKLVVAKRATSTTPATASVRADGSGRRVTYTVRSGDTLYSISRVLQVTVVELMGWNGLGKSSIIKPGQQITAFITGRG
jgi:membrane-bound lytic murein transglycosylase D